MPTEFKLQGLQQIKEMMKALGPAASKRAGTTGVRKAAVLMRRQLKAASPTVSGTLKKEWIYKKLRSRRNSSRVSYVVRLKARHYYELLEFEGLDPSQRVRRGNKRAWPKLEGEFNKFAEQAMIQGMRQASATIAEGTRTAIAEEAGKIYAKSLRYKR